MDIQIVSISSVVVYDSLLPLLLVPWILYGHDILPYTAESILRATALACAG